MDAMGTLSVTRAILAGPGVRRTHLGRSGCSVITIPPTYDAQSTRFAGGGSTSRCRWATTHSTAWLRRVAPIFRYDVRT